MSPGPRATYDTSATVRTAQGARIGYRLRGQEQLIHAITDLRRASDLGITSFLIYDEGMLSVVSSMRNDGIIPLKTHFKVSAHCGHGNPASINLLMRLGADSINPVRDLSLSMMCALRHAVSIVSELDHAANVSPWLREAKNAGAIVRELKIQDGTGQLLPEEAEAIVNERTRVVAFTANSSSIGTRPNVKALVTAIKSKNPATLAFYQFFKR